MNAAADHLIMRRDHRLGTTGIGNIKSNPVEQNGHMFRHYAYVRASTLGPDRVKRLLGDEDL